MLVSRGTHAGIGWLVVGVDSLGLADSMSFRILMMSPREVRLVPQDTTILAGASFLIRAYAVDVAGNTDSSSAVIRTDSAAVTVDSGVITGRAIGTATIDASFHSVATHATVSVVPDGHFLTIGRANGAVSIARTRTDGTERQVIYAEPASLVAPWSMDWIDPTSLVLPNPSGSGLLRVGLDGAATPIAIAVPPDSRHVQWVASAHDGRTVYFAYQVNLAEIWKADLISGSASLVLGSNFQAIDTYPSISPDGRLLLFTTTRGFGIATIGLLDLFSGGPPRLLGLRGVDARWFPDGQHFAYIAAPYLKVSGLDGSDQRYLTPVGATAGVGFNRSTDGQWIAIPGGPRITFVNVATGLTIAGPSAASVEWILWQ